MFVIYIYSLMPIPVLLTLTAQRGLGPCPCYTRRVFPTRMAPYNWEAAHIFPMEKENSWIHWNYGRWVTDMDDTMGVSKINSCQNRFLLQANIHRDFDHYLLSVNPDVSWLSSIACHGVNWLNRMGTRLWCLIWTRIGRIEEYLMKFVEIQRIRIECATTCWGGILGNVC